MTAQQLDADRVERAEPRHAFDLLAQHLTHTVLHFARGLVCECDGQNLIRARATSVHQMNDSRRQRTGLARSRPCKHQDRAVHLLYRSALCRIQSIQIRVRTRGHRTGRQGSALEGVSFIKAAHHIKLT